MRKASALFLVLLFVCICGCSNAGKDGVDLSEYEEVSDNFYVRADLGAEIPTVYMCCPADADPRIQWEFFRYVALPLNEIKKTMEIDNFCIYLDMGEEHIEYLLSDYEGLNLDEQIEKLPPFLAEHAGKAYFPEDDSLIQEWKKNIEEKLIKPIRETYTTD